MDPIALSILVWAIYVSGMGFMLIVFPNLLLPVFGFDKTHEPWIKVAGVIALALAPFYFAVAVMAVEEMYLISILPRLIGFLGLGALSLTSKKNKKLALFGAMDGLSAFWTFMVMEDF